MTTIRIGTTGGGIPLKFDSEEDAKDFLFGEFGMEEGDMERLFRDNEVTTDLRAVDFKVEVGS